MSASFEEVQKRRLISSYFSVILSVFLVLFLLGLLGFFVVNSKRLADNLREEIVMNVYFKNDADLGVLKSFEKTLMRSKYTKSFEFVSKDEAAKKHTEDIGEDFIKFIGENPLQNSYDIHLNAKYVVRDSVNKIAAEFKKNIYVSDVVYYKQLIELLNDNINKVSMWILIVSGFFTFIAVLLINSTLRLAIHSNRFIIKTMQMTGATKSFIRKPFIIKGLQLALISELLAIGALLASLIYLDINFPSLGLLSNKIIVSMILLAVFIIGILITWISTYFATQRFLNLRTDDLY